MSLFSKIGKVAKTALKAYATYQTGGVAGLAFSAAKGLSKKGAGGRVIQVPGINAPGQLPTIQASSMMGLGVLPQLGRAAAGALGRVLPGGAVAAGRAVIPAAGRAAGGLIAAGRGLARRFPRSASALAQLGLFAAGGYIYDQATGQIVGRRTYRRINPLNHRAAMRAARRVKAVVKLCHKIERSLPKRRSSGGKCAPAFKRRKC